MPISVIDAIEENKSYAIQIALAHHRPLKNRKAQNSWIESCGFRYYPAT